MIKIWPQHKLHVMKNNGGGLWWPSMALDIPVTMFDTVVALFSTVAKAESYLGFHSSSTDEKW
jgi:hypothetical protein